LGVPSRSGDRCCEKGRCGNQVAHKHQGWYKIHIVAQEQTIFKGLRQQLLWPSIHAAVDAYQKRRASNADHYEKIWRLIHICECVVISLAAAAISGVRELAKSQEFLKLRERCYGITWNSTEASLEKGPGALVGSIDKWIKIVQYVGSLPPDGSNFLAALQTFLVGPTGDSSNVYRVDLAPLVRAWSRACEVPPSVLAEKVSVKDAFQAINSLRNRFAHVPFPYDQLNDICRELEYARLGSLKCRRQQPTMNLVSQVPSL
jgi:hypothetical protein